MRYSQKLRRRMNAGAIKMFKKEGGAKTDFHIYCDKDHIGVDELADMYFCSIEKLKRAARKGIIKDANISGKKWFFVRSETIDILNKFKGKDGQLNFFNRKEKY